MAFNADSSLNKKKWRCEAQNFGNARNWQKKNSGLHCAPLGSVWIVTLHPLLGVSWIRGCPSTFCARFPSPSYHNTSNQVICSSLESLLEIFAFVGWHYLLLAFKAWRESSKMARPLIVMFLSTRLRNRTIVHHVFLAIENFQIFWMLFSYLHFALSLHSNLSCFLSPPRR